MKRIFILLIAIGLCLDSFAQTDSVSKQKPDTIKIGGMVIIREPGSYDTSKPRDRIFKINKQGGDQPANISTNWWIFDIGFSNYTDNTTYGPGTGADALAPGSNEDWFRLRAGRSRNINIWVFMQRLNMIKHVVNLKYGIGMELNNYHFDDKRIRFNKNPTLIDLGNPNPGKNKLAADYIAVPIMLNFNFSPNKRKNFGFSFGVLGGYLYGVRQKTKFEGKVNKVKSDFDIRKWKLSYVGEISLGPVKLYGSYAFRSMFEKGLELTPYNLGFRFSNW